MKNPYDWEPVDRSSPRIHRGTHRESGRVRYLVRFREHAWSAQTSKSFDELTDAKRFDGQQEMRRIRQRDGYGETPAPKKSATFIEWFEKRFLPVRTNEGTRHAHETRIKQIRSRPSGRQFLDLRVGLIRKVDVEAVLASCERPHGDRPAFAPGTVNGIRQTIFAVLNNAAENGELVRPTFTIKPRARPQRDDPPTMEELLLLLDAIAPRFRALAGLAAVTGLRSGELRGLAVTDVRGLLHNLRDGWGYDPEAVWRIVVRRQLSLDGLRLAAPKTAESAGPLLVEETALRLLVDHLNVFGSGPVMDGVALIFGGRSARCTVTGHQLYHAVSAASRRVLGRKVGPHQLRHGYATLHQFGGRRLSEDTPDGSWARFERHDA